MKITKIVSCLALVSIMAACGKGKGVSGMSTDLSSSGRSLGSCMITSSSSDASICIEFMQAGSVTDAGASAARSACNSGSSRSSSARTTFNSSGCRISSAVGFCSLSETGRQNGETVTLDQVMVMYSPMEESDARSACSRVSGRFSTTAPRN